MFLQCSHRPGRRVACYSSVHTGQVGRWHVSSAELESVTGTCSKPGVGGNGALCASPDNRNSVFLVSAFPRFIQLHFNLRSKRKINLDFYFSPPPTH